MTQIIRLAFLSVLLATIPALGFAQTLSNGQTLTEAIFSAAERRIISDYFGQGVSAQGKHKGGQGQKGLPPGIAKNLARGKPMPPGIAKRYLPNDLVGRLPPVRSGFERVIVGSDLLLVEIATNVIYDVIKDAVR